MGSRTIPVSLPLRITMARATLPPAALLFADASPVKKQPKRGMHKDCQEQKTCLSQGEPTDEPESA